MDSTVANDMKNSSTAFVTLVWPLINSWVGGGELLQMENVTDSNFAKMLDMKAGIDGWHIHSDGMRGIASRIQKGWKAWNTFTIRMSRDSGAKTEYEKRETAIETGKYIYPHLTVQAYVEAWEGPVLSIGMALTCDIIIFIQKGFHTLRRTTNAEFAVCPWDVMEIKGFKVKVFNGISQDTKLG